MSQYYYNPFASSDTNEAVQLEYSRMLKAKQEKHEIRMISLLMGCAIIAYLLVQSIAVLVLEALGLSELYTQNAVFQYAFTIISVSFASVALPFGIMALANKKRYTAPMIPNTRLKSSKAFVWICFGMICCVGANIGVSAIVTLIEDTFGLKLGSGEVSDPDSIFACFMSVIAISIIPAVCEEFAMRCCSLQLLRKYGKGFSVVAVSIVFGLLHGNVVQFIFAFAVGLVLGFVTVRTDSIVPAIFIHAFNNGMSVVQLLVCYAADEKTSETVTVLIYLFWIISGALATVYLLIKKELFVKDKNKYGVLTTGQKFSAFLFPCMIIPFLILIAITATTIEKI